MFPCLLLSLFANDATCEKNIMRLKKEIHIAKQECLAIKTKITSLEETLAQLELERIKNKLDSMKDIAISFIHENDFKDDREILRDIIRRQFTCAPEAQKVFDQILTLITQASNRPFDQ